jgi:hypothetical protein
MLNVRKPLEAKKVVLLDPTPSFDEQKIELLRQTLLAKQQKIGEQGEELEHLEEMLEHQQEINHEALLDIQQQLHQQPAELEEMLQEVQMDVQNQQQEVFDQQEEQFERKELLMDKQLQLQLQQQHLSAIMKELSGRKKDIEDDGVVPEVKDPKTLKLIELGIYSDPHLLAVMYMAELSYYYILYSERWKIFDDSDLEATTRLRDLRFLGQSNLSVYIEAVTNCGLAEVGWSCHRAKQLLDYFNELPRVPSK